MKASTLLFLPVLCLANCGKKDTAVLALPTTQASTSELDSFFVDQAPSSPGEIHNIRSTAMPGDTLTLTGLIMGRDAPFVESRAAFVLGDRNVITPCNEKPGDSCETPWDTCCNTPEERQSATATIQLVGPDGRVLKQGLKGIHGLTELSSVTIIGTVDKASTPQALIINATQIHVASK
jgi:hypothetical protein